MWGGIFFLVFSVFEIKLHEEIGTAKFDELLQQKNSLLQSVSGSISFNQENQNNYYLLLFYRIYYIHVVFLSCAKKLEKNLKIGHFEFHFEFHFSFLSIPR